MSEPTKADESYAHELWRWCLDRAGTYHDEENPEFVQLRKRVKQQFAIMVKSMRQQQEQIEELECLLAQKEEEEQHIVIYKNSPAVHSASPAIPLRGGIPDDD